MMTGYKFTYQISCHTCDSYVGVVLCEIFDLSSVTLHNTESGVCDTTIND